MPANVAKVLLVLLVTVFKHLEHLEDALFNQGYGGAEDALRILEEIGGAKMPLQKLLGSNVTVGNNLIKFDISRLENQWEQQLERLLVDLGTFRRNLLDAKISQYPPYN
mgnify:CR=1 FL=1